MFKAADPAAMQALDRYAIDTLGVPGLQLMLAAAGKTADAAQALLETNPGPAAVFCGTGNNGGDGFAAAALLRQRGQSVRCFLVGARERLRGDALETARRWEALGGVVEPFQAQTVRACLDTCTVAIDALFGTGLNRDLTGDALAAVRLLNASPAKVVACDIASGVRGDTGQVLADAVNADVTVTFTMAKPGQLLPPGWNHTGQLRIVDIGIPPQAQNQAAVQGELTDAAFVASLLPRRKRDAHKGDFGRLVLFAGSRGLTGAAALAARAALRSGGGLISLGVPEAVYPILAAKLDEVMVFPLPCDEAGRLSLAAWPEIEARLGRCDAALWGPGLGRSPDLDALTRLVLERAKAPLVLDADGINAVAGHIDVLRGTTCQLVLTPHEGEFARLSDALHTMTRLAAAKALAAASGAVVALKGYRTITASPEGLARFNTTGNPGMATGGSGDALAGILVSFLGQGLTAFDAASAAAWVHGGAGDRAAQTVGEYGLTPSDLIAAIPQLLH